MRRPAVPRGHKFLHPSEKPIDPMFGLRFTPEQIERINKNAPPRKMQITIPIRPSFGVGIRRPGGPEADPADIRDKELFWCDKDHLAIGDDVYKILDINDRAMLRTIKGAFHAITFTLTRE